MEFYYFLNPYSLGIDDRSPTHCVHHAFKKLIALELFCYGKVTDPNTLV